MSATVSAEDIKIDLKQLAQQYFDTMVATQAPGATKVELENHLSLLADDIGHSHLPWVIGLNKTGMFVDIWNHHEKQTFTCTIC